MNMVYRMMTIKLLLFISIDMDFSLGSSRLFPLVESHDLEIWCRSSVAMTYLFKHS